MYKPSSQKKLREIANKHGISLATANEIIESQWSLLRMMIASAKPYENDYPVFGIKHLGKFVVTKKRKYIMSLKQQDQNDKS